LLVRGDAWLGDIMTVWPADQPVRSTLDKAAELEASHVMRMLIAAVACCLALSSCRSAPRPRDENVAAPDRIAVAMRSGDQLGPFTIEATKTGWVSISLYSSRPDQGFNLPMSRMIADARDMKAWVARARSFLEARDSGAMFGMARVGRGAYELEIQRLRNDPNDPIFAWRACGPGWGSTQPSVRELLGFLALVDSAATMAGGASGAGQPPTLSRGYYGSEVSCPPRPKDDNARLAAPPGLAAPPEDIGAEFIVDTSGRVEPASIRFLAKTPPSAAQAARSTISAWRFQPAMIDGFLVRGIVQTALSFRPKPAPGRRGRWRAGADASDDGWVRVFVVRGVDGGVTQQWFHPDSIDAWMSRVQMRASAIAADTNPSIQESLSLGPEEAKAAGHLVKRDRRVDMILVINTCASGVEEDAPVPQPSMFTDAAHRARAKARSPVDPRNEIHEAEDVSCPAWLPWTRSAIRGFERVYRYPTAPYPASMQGQNARADVLASFVVDTLGVADGKTIQVMAGSDARAAGAVRAALKALRFRPATRGGMKVRQRAIQILRFEPPSLCLTRDAGPACP
jgi:hypothetical protein